MHVDLPRRKRADLIVDEIKRWMVSEGHRPGDRLPQERDLITIFRASKGTIREALKSLEVQGLVRVSTGPGGGAQISEVSYAVTAELLGNYFFFKKLDASAVYQVRRLVEPELAAAATPNLTESHFGRLERAIEVCSRPPSSPEEQEAQRIAELEFHNVLADACTNELLSFVAKFINHFLADLVSFKKMYLDDQEAIRLENLKHHESILSALRDGDANRVRRTMAEHMNDCASHAVQMEAVVANRFLGRGEIKINPAQLRGE